MKYARLELERRFLLESPPPGWSAEQPHRLIQDRYLVGTRLRLRRVESPDGVQLKLGQKEPVEGLPGTHRRMTSLYLDEAEYRLLEGLPARSLTKRRYPLATGVLDVFPDGLMLLEVEFPDEESLRAFQPACWMGREVTEQARYTGLALSGPAAGS